MAETKDNKNYSSMSIGATENIVFLTGYLGKVEIFTTDDGLMIARGSIGTKKVVKNAETGERETPTQWHRFVAYRNRAAIIDRAIRGDNEQKFRIAIRGRLNESSYQSKMIPIRPDGKPNMLYSTDVIVDRITFCGRINFANAESDNSTPETEEVPAPTGDNEVDF